MVRIPSIPSLECLRRRQNPDALAESCILVLTHTITTGDFSSHLLPLNRESVAATSPVKFKSECCRTEPIQEAEASRHRPTLARTISNPHVDILLEKPTSSENVRYNHGTFRQVDMPNPHAAPH